jgi:methionyl-tRNA formyltransferase
MPPRHPSRLVFLGTPEIAVAPLHALHAAGHDIALVVSRPDTRRGRRGHDTPSPVKAAALALALPVSDSLDDVADSGADLGVVAAYGRIIPARVLERVPMINIHYSLLPRWRGAAPVERAILAGDRETGVCVMTVEEGLDTGAVYDRRVLAIGEHETADELRLRLVDASNDALLAVLRDGLDTPVPQEGEPTYADKIEPADLALNWTLTAVELERVVRVGGAWTTFRHHRLKVWRALAQDDTAYLAPGQIAGDRVGTGAGTLQLIEVQAEGKPRRTVHEWQHGARPTSDDRLGE